mmetsp:Transcript_26891/g.46076  ORF Transcript_26891/g.46076 Transcript_26891/m.46076 type:complete len:256 (-) Transcript_26891:892-1659(-)
MSNLKDAQLRGALQRLVQTIHQSVHVLLAEYQRGLHFDHVGIRSVATHDHTLVAQVIHEELRQLWVGLQVVAFLGLHELNALEQTRAAHVADPVVLGDQRGEALGEVVADHPGILLEVFFNDGVHHSLGDGAGHAVASVGVEVLNATGGEGLGNLATAHHGGDRVTVAHGLAHRDNVRHDAVILKHPKVGARTSKARLHLVRNAHTAGLTHRRIDTLQVSGRRNHLSTAAHDGLSDERADTACRTGDELLHFGGI